ncbi:MAG: Wadjet anti-phage system protein JetD domain-containing protein [Fusobacteriota bacterium]
MKDRVKIIKKRLFRYIKERKRKRIETKTLNKIFKKGYGDQKYYKKQGYLEFYNMINELEKEKVLEPIKSWKKNGMNPELYNGYRKVMQKRDITKEEKRELLSFYHPKININYYIKDIRSYRKDIKELKQIDKFLKDNQDKLDIAINERSFDIFGDEKFLASKSGRQILKRLKITLDDLRCYETYEPFFYYSNNSDSSKINALIVENKDTFYSLKKLFQSRINCWDDKEFDLLIYGEGKKILKSLSFFEELETYKSREVYFHYFGDIDPVGIEIWYKLDKKYDYFIEPFGYFYDKLLEINYQKRGKIKKNQRINEKAIKAFDLYIKDSLKINSLIKNREYIPQEGLSFEILKRLGEKENE